MSAGARCPQCGAAQSADQRFCTTCGASVGDAPPSAAPPPDAASSVTAAQPVRRRRWWPWAVAGIVALLAVGAGVVMANPGLLLPSGSSDPDALVAELTAALNDGDVRTLAGLVHPDEIDPFIDVLPATIDRLRQEGLLEQGDQEALEISLTDLEYDLDELVEGVTRIDIEDGTLTLGGLTAQGSILASPSDGGLVAASSSVGPLAAAAVDEPFTETEDGLEVDLGALADEEDVFLVAAEHGGGWYLSLTYSVMELVVQEEDVDGIDDGNERLLPPPAESPSAALESFVEAFQDEQYEQVIGSVYFPGDFTAHYADAFEQLVEALEEEMDLEGIEPDDLSLDDLSVTENSLGGGLVELVVEDLRVEYDGPDLQAAMEFDGECVLFEEPDYEDEECLPDDFAELSGIQDVSIVVRELGEGYALDVAATYANYLRQIVEGADGAVIRKALGQPEVAPEPAALEMGASDLELDTAGTWVAEFTGENGQVLALQHDGFDGRAYVVGPDGQRLHAGYGCSDGTPCVYTLEESGSHRLVLDAWALGAEDIRVGIDVLDADPQELPRDGTTVDLDPGQVALYEVPARGVEVRLGGDYTVVDGGDRFSETFTGDVLIAVSAGIDGGSARVTATEPPPLGFAGGGLTRSGSIGTGDTASFVAIVPVGQRVRVRVVPTNSSFDPVLELYASGEGDYADNGLEGDPEEGAVTAGADGQVEVYVAGWGVSSGSFTVELIP